MFTIIYDPIKGKATPDGLVVELTKELWLEHQKDILNIDNNGVFTSSFMLVDTFRCLIKEGIIPCQQIELKYEDHTILFNDKGVMSESYPGMGDHYEKLLWRLVDWGKS